MSYAAGAATMNGNAAVDVKMPGNIKDEIVTIATQISALDKLIQARAGLPADFVTGWNAFKAEWNAFAHNHRFWVQNMWYASYEKAIEYRKRLEDFRGKFEGLTGTKVNYPSPGGTPQGLTDDGKGFPWKVLIWGGVIIGGVYGVSKLLAETSQLKREIVGSRALLPGREHVHNHHHAAELEG